MVTVGRKIKVVGAMAAVLALLGVGIVTTHGGLHGCRPFMHPVSFARSLPGPAVLFVGDSYAAGSSGLQVRDAFACRAAAELGWGVVIDAQGGTGYVSAGLPEAGTRSYPDRLAELDPDVRPRWVVVSGGRNDLGRVGQAKAAADYFSALGARYPGAYLVVLSPFWNTVDAPPGVERMRQALKSAAVGSGASWIDTAGWIQPSDVGPDGVHPSARGQAALAQRLAAALRELEIQGRAA